jgi:PAS domain-containing protein
MREGIFKKQQFGPKPQVRTPCTKSDRFGRPSTTEAADRDVGGVMTVGEQQRNDVDQYSGNRTGGLPLEEKDLLRTMLDAMAVIAFAIDTNGVLIYRAGGGAVLARDDVLGHPVTEIWPTLHAEIAQALSGNTVRVDFAFHGRVFDITYHPLIVDGRQAGVVGLSWDVTDQRRQDSLSRRRRWPWSATPIALP